MEGPGPDRVELYVDGVLLSRLQSPYEYPLDTASFAEGSHDARAKACRADECSEASHSVVVDRTQPAIFARSPSAGGSLKASPPQLTFTEAILPSSVTEDSIVLMTEAGERLRSNLAFSSDGRTVSISPASPIPLPAKLKIVLSDTFQDLAGNSLIAPLEREWEFSVTPLPAKLVAENPYGNRHFKLRAEMEGEVVDSVQLLVDDRLTATFPTSYEYELDLEATPEGTYKAEAFIVKGNFSFRTEPLVLTVDRSAPHLIPESLLPKPGSTYAVLGNGIEVKFSEPMSELSLRPELVSLKSLKNGETEPIEVDKVLRLSEDGTALRIYPRSIPHLGNEITQEPVATLSIEVKGEVADRAGNPVAVDVKGWSFKIRAWEPVGNPFDEQQNPPTYDVSRATVNSPDIRISNTRMTLDGSDRPVVAYLREDEWFLVRFDGTRWQPSETDRKPIFQSDDPVKLHSINIAEKNGTVVTAWKENDRIVVRRFHGANLAPEDVGSELEPIVQDDLLLSVIMFDPTGSLVVAGKSIENGEVAIQIFRWTDSGWQKLSKSVASGNVAYDLKLQFGTNGILYVSWMNEIGGNVARWTGNWDSGE